MLHDTFQFKVALEEEYTSSYDCITHGVVYLGEDEVFRTRLTWYGNDQEGVETTMRIFASKLETLLKEKDGE